jgi:FkbM family methyltransferase
VTTASIVRLKENNELHAMIKYFKESFKRKVARRITKEYPFSILRFELEQEGIVEFANWENPLVSPVSISQSDIDFFRKFIKEGDFIIDIGANIGDTTVPMAIAAGKDGLTLGFDPNPYVYKILEVNSKLNRDKSNIVPVCSAISTEEEEFYFISSEASFANGGISPTPESIHGKFIYPEKVKGVNLFNFLKENHKDQLDKFSFIKIDTEGYDKEIIRSIADLIKAYKPVIVAESFGKSPDKAKMELYELISIHGYTIFYFEDFTQGTKIVEIKTPEQMCDWQDTINIYALPN